MRGQILIVLLIRSMDVFKTFDIVYALTFGGPGQSTTVATFYLYRQAFTQFKLGYGAALSWIIFIIVYLDQLRHPEGVPRTRSPSYETSEE